MSIARIPTLPDLIALCALLFAGACASGPGGGDVAAPGPWPADAPGWNPPDIAAHRAYQERLRRRGEGHRAHEHYRAEYHRRPRSGAAAYLHGRLRKDLDEQAALFGRAIRLDPMLSWGHHGLAVVASRRGSPSAARRSYRRAVSLAPECIDHLLGLADLERREGRLAEAEGAARQARGADPSDPRAWALLGRILQDLGERAAALTMAHEAVLASGQDRIYRAQWRRLVLAVGSDAVVRFALRQALAWPVDGERATSIGLLRLRLGDLERGVASLSEARAAGIDAREITGPWRRALVRLGRYREALRVDGWTTPAVMRTAAGNVLAGAWAALLRSLDALKARPGDPMALLALSRSFAAVGWESEAGTMARRATMLGAEGAAEALGETLAVGDVISRLAASVERGYRGQGGAAGSLDDLLARADSWFRRAGLAGRPSEADRRSYAFVGEIVEGRRAGASALHDRLREHGRILLLGQPAGGPVEVLLGEAVAEEPGRRVTVLGRALEHDRYVVAHMRIGSYRTVHERGDLSGVALDGFYLLNLDEIAVGPYGADGRAGVAPWRPVEPDDRRCIDWPGGVLARLAGGIAEPAASVRRDLVARHEEGHLLDVERFLPVHRHLIAGLGLAVSSGLSPHEMQGRLEGNAQLVAMVECRSPRAALRGIVALGTARESSPPHSLGYHDVLRDLVEEIAARPGDYPAFDREANVLQQLDRLTDPEIRELGRILLTRRGLP